MKLDLSDSPKKDSPIFTKIFENFEKASLSPFFLARIRSEYGLFS